MPPSPEPLAGSSRLLPLIETVNSDQRLDQNTRRWFSSILNTPIAMFSNIENLCIRGGNFTQIINNRNENILRHLESYLQPRSRDAAFNAAINFDNLARRPCTKDTRVDILEQIMAWINEKDPAKAPPVYWLAGLAGLGKTTIAYTICKSLTEARLPFASFFCSLQLDSKDSRLLVNTLCLRLAELYSSYAVNVLSTLETDSTVVHAVLRVQIEELLAKPWQTSIAQRQGRDIPIPIVVVDALDELESDRGIVFLEELLRIIDSAHLKEIKFLVTSRLNPEIFDLCKSFPPNAVCKLHQVDTNNVQNDIEKYLREALPQLKDEPELALLSHQAGGFFIYATTAVRFISPPRSRPAVSEMRSHLKAMVNAELLTSHADTCAASDERLLVDELYERILVDAFQNTRFQATRLPVLHTIICAESAIGMSVLADLAEAKPDVVEKLVESLHAVLFVSPKDGCVHWYHTSFRDFVVSRARATISPSPFYPMQRVIDVFCNASARHRVLARRCFSIMHESLHFNMCNIPSSYLFDSEVPGLTASIDKAISPTLRYASRHWAKHLRRAAPAESETDDLLCDLKDFLCNKLLFWMEAMNLIGGKSECSSLLEDAKSWLQQGKESPDLLGQLTDATKFSIFFAGSPASKSTPHLYISALAVWNQDSPTLKSWKDRFGFIPSISQTRGTIAIPLLTISTGSVRCVSFSADGNQIVSGSFHSSVCVWNAKTGEQLMVLQGHTDRVNSVAVSHDGSLIASGSEDKSVRVWDAEMGEQLRELLGHTRQVMSVAFSPDGNQIVSGSYDRSVRVWGTKTGELLRELQGHTDIVWSATFSYDGNQIVSGSSDKSVRVWDKKTGQQLRVMQGHTGEVETVAISPDGNQIVSGSNDSSVRVWDAKTGEQLKELHGHSSWVGSVAFSPDGNRIVSGSYDKSVMVWDAKTGEQLKELQGHNHDVRSVTFSPDGNRIISGSLDGSIQIWDAKMSEQLGEPQGHIGWVSSVAVSSNGNQIVSGSHDKSVRVWDAKTGEQLKVMQGHTGEVQTVAFSPDGNQFVSGSDDKSVRLWDVNSAKELRKLQGDPSWVTSFAFSSDCNRMASGSSDNSVWVWDTKTGKMLMELQGHTHPVASVTFSPDGHQVVSGSFDKSVRVWNARTGEQLRELQHAGYVTSVAFSADSNQIVSSAHNDSVHVWDANTGEKLRELQGHTGCVTSVAYSADSNRIVSGSSNKSVVVWDAMTGGQLRELQGHTGCVTSVAFSPDNTQVISGSVDKSVRVWDVNSGQLMWELQGHAGCVTLVGFSPDGNQIVSGSHHNSVLVWDARTGKQLRKLQGHYSRVGSVVYSPDSNEIVIGFFDKSVRVWDAKTFEVLRELQGDTGEVTSVAFSPDGNLILGSFNKSIRVWDAEMGEQSRELQGHTDKVNSASFSADSNKIVSASDDKSVLVWDARTGALSRVLQGHTDKVNSAAFSPDSTRIVSGSDDKSVLVWDAKTGERLMELHDGHISGWVGSVAFSPDGNRIVSGSSDHSVRVWDAKTGERLRELQGHTSPVVSVTFSPDGNRIVSGSSDHSVRVWDNLNLDAAPSWVMNDRDGWILSGPERLAWVPWTVRNVLLRPPNILIISRNDSATISFTQCKSGTSWHECYTP